MHGRGNYGPPSSSSSSSVPMYQTHAPPPRPAMPQGSSFPGPPLYPQGLSQPPQHGGILGPGQPHTAGHLNPQYLQHFGSQNAYQIPLPRPPPPPCRGQAMYINCIQHAPSSGSAQGLLHISQPLSLPPPPLLCSSAPSTSEPFTGQMISDPVVNISSNQSANVDTVGDSHVNCQDRVSPHVGSVVKDGSSTQDNPILDLPSGSSAVLSVEASLQCESLMDAGVSHSPSNSDMDMEDDVTHFGEELETNKSFEVLTEKVGFAERLQALSSEHDDNSPKNVMCVSGQSDKGHNSVTSVAVSSGSPLNINACIRGLPGQHNVGNYPLEVVQGYVSNNSTGIENEPSNLDMHAVKTLLVASDPKSLEVDAVSCRPSIIVGGTGSPNMEHESSSVSPATELSPGLVTGQRFSSESQLDVSRTVVTPQVTEEGGAHIDNQDGSPVVLKCADVKEATQTESGVAIVTESEKSQKYEIKSAPILSKIDEFGRLVRDGGSESESDDVRRNQRHSRRGWSRSKSRSRSSSPRDRRKRRSPRRKEKRSRSRSWSPRRRRSRSRSSKRRRSRSRSRSPGYRRGRGLGGGENRIRDKGQVCFDFLKGRCYRGTSCRFAHHDSDRNDGSKHHKSKQQTFEVSRSKVSEDTKMEFEKVSSRGHTEVKGLDSERVVLDLDISKGSKGVADQIQETKEVVEESEGQVQDLSYKETIKVSIKSNKQMVVGSLPSQPVACASELLSDTSKDLVFPVMGSVIPCSRAPASAPVVLGTSTQPQKMDDSSISDLSHDQSSKNPLSTQLPVDEPDLNKSNAESFAAANPTSQPLLSENLSLQHPPLSNQPSHSQGVDALHVARDYNFMQPTGSLPLHLPPGISIPSYPAPLSNQYIHPIAPANSTWASLPLPPPPPFRPYAIGPNVYASATNPGFSASFLSQAGDNRQKFPSVGNPQSQAFGGLRNDNICVQGVFPSTPHVQGNMQAQTMPPSTDSSAGKILSVPGDSLRSKDPYKLPSQGHTYLQQEQQPHGQPSAPNNASEYMGLSGQTSSTSRHLSDNLGASQLSRLSNFGGSKITTHHNPYASTFDQPLTSKFSSTSFGQEVMPGTVGQGTVGLGSRQVSHPSNPAGATIDQSLTRSGGDQYDPLFDSIEPSPNSLVKSDNVQRLDSISGSNVVLRSSASQKPLDVEENNKRKEVTDATLLENDEFGENAEAGAGAVEDESLSNPTGFPNTDAGEIEIDQKSPGERKKNKDSRSMKLFKSAIADFVKEVLKPSWRQGNMSKEAFKTIVKKTVDKVSGAMKGHHVPKSQVKIDQYIDSSQRKLTNLVMGYVDKYVKV